jgi:cysteine synthase A
MKRLIGNTPLLALALRVGGEPRTIYAKYEPLNLTGSIKDRMALHILQRAYETGRIAPGDPIAEGQRQYVPCGDRLRSGIPSPCSCRTDEHRAHRADPSWRLVVLVSKADGGFLVHCPRRRHEGRQPAHLPAPPVFQ